MLVVVGTEAFSVSARKCSVTDSCRAADVGVQSVELVSTQLMSGSVQSWRPACVLVFTDRPSMGPVHPIHVVTVE